MSVGKDCNNKCSYLSKCVVVVTKESTHKRFCELMVATSRDSDPEQKVSHEQLIWRHFLFSELLASLFCPNLDKRPLERSSTRMKPNSTMAHAQQQKKKTLSQETCEHEISDYSSFH